MMDEMSAFGFKERASLVDKGAPSNLISMTKNLHIDDSSDVGCNEERMETLSQHSGKLLMMSSRSAERQRGKEEIEIHNENLETLSKMSHEEILDERRKLESTLGRPCIPLCSPQIYFFNFVLPQVISGVCI